MPNPDRRIPKAGMPRATHAGVTPPRAPLPAPKSAQGEGDWERITPETRAKVWKKRFGFRSTGTCVCCHRTLIHRDSFLCGHRRTFAGGGGNDVSNLEPICASCKEKVGTHDLLSWCRKIENEFKVVKPMPVKKTVKTAAKKAAPKVKKTMKKSTAKKPVAKKVVKKTAAKKAKK